MPPIEISNIMRLEISVYANHHRVTCKIYVNALPECYKYFVLMRLNEFGSQKKRYIDPSKMTRTIVTYGTIDAARYVIS